jgi:hypothetical protein
MLTAMRIRGFNDVAQEDVSSWYRGPKTLRSTLAIYNNTGNALALWSALLRAPHSSPLTRSDQLCGPRSACSPETPVNHSA